MTCHRFHIETSSGANSRLHCQGCHQHSRIKSADHPGQSLSLIITDNSSNISQMRPVRLVAKLQIVAGLRGQFGSLLAIILCLENNCLTSFPAHSEIQQLIQKAFCSKPSPAGSNLSLRGNRDKLIQPGVRAGSGHSSRSRFSSLKFNIVHR